MRPLFTLGALTVLLVGCDTPPSTAIGNAPTLVVEQGSERAPSADRIARAIALSLRDDSVRHRLRDAWRDSRLTSDHKLVLSDFLESTSGNALLRAMSLNAAVGGRDPLALVKELPSMDFYVPIRAHRERWSGTNDLLVGVTFDLKADRITAYSTSGEAVQVDARTAEAGPTLVILHPAEPKYPDMGGQRYSTGDRIQLPFEQAYQAAAERVASGRTDASVAPTSGGGVFLRWFDTFSDDGPFGGDVEMEFRSYGYEGGVPYYTGSFWLDPATTCNRGTGIGTYPPNPPITVSPALLISAGLSAATLQGCGGSSSTRGYAVVAVEMDFGPGTEDDFGRRFTSGGAVPYGLTIGTPATWAYHDFHQTPSVSWATRHLRLGLSF